jgi:hypothetical protein
MRWHTKKTGNLSDTELAGALPKNIKAVAKEGYVMEW